MNTKFFLYFGLLCWLMATASCKKKDGGPGISSISPTSGLPGNLVSIKGHGFADDPSQNNVQFNGQPGQVVRGTSTELFVRVPDNATTGAVTVTVNGVVGRGPVYTISSISITAINPDTGVPGTTVTIQGSGLTNTGKLGELADVPVVTFNNKVAKLLSFDSAKLVVQVPDSAGFGPVGISLNGQTVQGPDFYYLGINSVSPLTGNVGTRITFTGGFGAHPSSDTVTINGKPTQIVSAKPGELVVKVLPGDTTGTIVVHAGGQTINGRNFTFVPLPAITSVIPSGGQAGAKVTVYGKNFSPVTAEDSVWINGVSAKVVSAAFDQIVILAPVATTGPVSVTINSQSVTGPSFAYQNLGISGISPANAFPPDTVTISGTGFSTDLTKDLVKFNSVAVTVISAKDTQLVVKLPGNVTTGPVTIQVDGLSATGPVFSTAGVTTFAGGSSGFNNGVGTAAQFQNPVDLVFDRAGNMFVTDDGANAIRKITPDGTVTLFAGDPAGGAGNADGQGTSASFYHPLGIVIDKNDNLYVGDLEYGLVRKITPDGTVSTLGYYFNAAFMAIDPSGDYLYVSSYFGGLWKVSTIDGTSTDYPLPRAPGAVTGMVVDAAGNFYASTGSGKIYKNGAVVLTGLTGVNGITLDRDGNLLATAIDSRDPYFGNPLSSSVSVIDPYSYHVTRIAGGTNGYVNGPLTQALFNTPYGLKAGPDGAIYIADGGNNAIRKIAR